MRQQKIRTELQVTSTECGLCCLAMILHSFGSTDSTASLREELDVGRDGATLSQLRAAFEARGVTTKVYRANAQGLEALDGPSIVFWENYHFMVLLKLTDGYARVIDPAIGHRRLTREEFEAGFSGLVLHPHRGAAASLHADDERSAATDSPGAVFKTAARRTLVPLAGVVALTVVSYAATLGMPILTQRLIDATVRHPDHQVFGGRIPLIFVGCVVGLVLASYARSVFVARASVTIGRYASERVMGHLLGLPLKFFDTRPPGELAYRLNGVTAIRDVMSSQMIVGVFEIGTVFVYAGYLFHESVQLALVAVSIVLLLLALLFGSRRRVYSSIQNEIVQTGKSQTMQLEAIQSVLTIKASGSSGFFLSRWSTENDLALRYLGERARLQGAVNAIVSGVQVAAPLVILMVGLQLWQDGTLSLGTVIAAQAIGIALFGSASSIYSSVTQVMLCQQFGRRLRDILQTERETLGQDRPTDWAPLEVRDVTYAYTKQSPPVLENVTMDVRRGEKVAIVGATGSGKSTLARLILGLYTPQSGEILYGGRPIGELDRDEVMQDVAFVPQSITLETMSLSKNIGLGRNATDEEIRSACEKACIARDIEALPMGYETLVSNLGDNFSGGQRQRIGIARALARRPSLLVLDEATSSLDHATELAIMDNITSMDCAAVIIAHRLASVVHADRIVVLDRGRIVEIGTHAELLDRGGHYWSMFGGQVAIGQPSVVPS